MPTREQNLKKALEEAKQGPNVFNNLQRQVDLLVQYVTKKK